LSAWLVENCEVAAAVAGGCEALFCKLLEPLPFWLLETLDDVAGAEVPGAGDAGDPQ
jgi:hypothetical protein